MADFSHVKWDQMHVVQDEKSGRRCLFIMPKSKKQDPWGIKRDKLALVCTETEDKIKCPITALEFCKARMDTTTAGPFYGAGDLRGRDTKRNFMRYVRKYASVSKNLGYTSVPTGHSWRASTLTDALNLGFDDKFIRKMFGWADQSPMTEHYDRAAEEIENIRKNFLQLRAVPNMQNNS